jgi:hypothetical protein
MICVQSSCIYVIETLNIGLNSTSDPHIPRDFEGFLLYVGSPQGVLVL